MSIHIGPYSNQNVHLRAAYRIDQALKHRSIHERLEPCTTMQRSS